MNENSPRPSEIRRRVLEQHKTIRDRVDAIEEKALAAVARDEDGDGLLSALEDLLGILETHMRFEESVVPDLLLEADAWGEVRVGRFHADHCAQRTLIERLRVALSTRGEMESALLALGFGTLLRNDIAFEEKAFFAEEILRDDPVAIAPEPE